jgi:hypothetical protein
VQNTRSNMKKWRSIAVIIVMVCLMIGQSGCTGIFDSTKSEVRIAKKVLKEKYNEDFEIITLGGRWGTLTNDTFTVKCYPVSDPDCIFKAEIQKEGHYVFDEYVSTRVCKRLKTEIEEMMNGVQVSAYIEAVPSSNDGTDSNVSYEEFVKENKVHFGIFLVIGDSYESVSGSVETLVEKYPCLKDSGSRVLYWENVSSEKINEFDELAKEATTFNGTMQALLEHPPIIVELQTEY